MALPLEMDCGGGRSGGVAHGESRGKGFRAERRGGRGHGAGCGEGGRRGERVLEHRECRGQFLIPLWVISETRVQKTRKEGSGGGSFKRSTVSGKTGRCSKARVQKKLKDGKGAGEVVGTTLPAQLLSFPGVPGVNTKQTHIRHIHASGWKTSRARNLRGLAR